MRVLCTGPESSGTRLLTRLADGFEGVEATHHSLPHGDEWPTYQFACTFDAVLVSTRSEWPTLTSAVHAGHARHLTEARTRYVEAIDWVGGLVIARDGVALVSYEDVTMRGLEVVAEALALVGHLQPTRWRGRPVALVEQNSKWSNLSVEIDAPPGMHTPPDTYTTP